MFSGNGRTEVIWYEEGQKQWWWNNHAILLPLWPHAIKVWQCKADAGGKYPQGGHSL
jgi:hypothetical protein